MPECRQGGGVVPIVIRLPAAGEAGSPDAEGDVELTVDRAGAEHVWRLLLAMAVEGGASSVHFHPWREDSLSCVAGDRRYVFDPPPPGMLPLLLPAVRSLVGLEPRPSLLNRLLARPEPPVGTAEVVLETPDSRTEWVVVWWSLGESGGVDFYRTGLPPDGPEKGPVPPR
jgi:hypothetical protein